MRFVKPLDEALVLETARTHQAIVTVEEGVIAGGAGSAVTEALANAGITIPVLQLGLPDVFVHHGEAGQLLSLHKLDATGIVETVRRRFPAITE
jgi:1-deoxy-D-xylulose-5-phosphate synthase